MTDEMTGEGPQAEVRSEAEAGPDPKAENLDLQARIAHLEEDLASRERDLAALRESLSGAVARYRAAALAAAPGLPGDLVRGETVEEIDASLALAQGIVSKVREQLENEAAQSSVPAGAPPRTPPDLSALSPTEKIAHALRSSTR